MQFALIALLKFSVLGQDRPSFPNFFTEASLLSLAGVLVMNFGLDGDADAGRS